MIDDTAKTDPDAVVDAAITDPEELLEKAAAEAPSEEDFLDDDPERFEKKGPVKDPFPQKPKEEETDEAAEEDDDLSADTNDKWGDAPSIRDQMERQPTTVRYINTKTEVFDLSDSAQARAFNKLEAAQEDAKAPTAIFLHRETQAYNGKWSILLTHAKMQYLQL